MKVDPLRLIQKYYGKNKLAYKILVTHSKMVTLKALELADKVKGAKPDKQFLQEAAMLHDIGIFLTNAPSIGCKGGAPYLMHGPLGREILEKEGLPKHALVCDRHTGVGLTKKEIEARDLPLPKRNMLPLSLEEKIICFADCFYGKSPGKLRTEKSIVKVEKNIAKFGPKSVARLVEFRRLFRV